MIKEFFTRNSDYSPLNDGLRGWASIISIALLGGVSGAAVFFLLGIVTDPEKLVSTAILLSVWKFCSLIYQEYEFINWKR